MPKKRSLNEFKEMVYEKFNDKFQYNFDEFKNWTTPLTIICPKHGSFKMSPKHFLKTKYGCLKCSQEAQTNKSRNLKVKNKPKSGKPITKEEFLKKAHEKFGDKFSYDLTNFKNEKNNNQPIKIICPKHGEFEKIPRVFLRSAHGCNKCCHENTNKVLHEKSKIFKKEDFVKMAKKVHGNYYDYSQMNYDTKNKLKIICPKHGEFYQRAWLHLRGEGCPICAKKGILNCENRMIRLIQDHFPNLEIIHDKTQDFLKPYRYDCYIPSLKIAIEYHGSQHFEKNEYLTDYRHDFEKTQKHDKIKYELSKQNNVKLIYFTFSSKYENINYLDKVYTKIEDVYNIIENSIKNMTK